ncbi:hypothetical protein L4174_014440 [Photobacterium sp. CCB-ST2H9]|uniref:hypothetical protein n=1 Tax=Photobacterium sp. CCB-ST2H9 TaxID=2912855 RepID=UPI0020059C6C|nr:hypothetical protein [Photobacterium sp. CCB-ST2H9]UTM56995.1 hypothetical protein L4174_014440 [Photobacterium sp. CCB-ST2H9]
MRYPFESVWHKGLLALLFSLFILTTPVQILHDLSVLSDTQHSEFDCPYCHAAPAGLLSYVHAIPTQTFTAAPDIPPAFSRVDWLSPPPSARDPPIRFR